MIKQTWQKYYTLFYMRRDVIIKSDPSSTEQEYIRANSRLLIFILLLPDD